MRGAEHGPARQRPHLPPSQSPQLQDDDNHLFLMVVGVK